MPLREDLEQALDTYLAHHFQGSEFQKYDCDPNVPNGIAEYELLKVVPENIQDIGRDVKASIAELGVEPFSKESYSDDMYMGMIRLTRPQDDEHAFLNVTYFRNAQQLRVTAIAGIKPQELS